MSELRPLLNCCGVAFVFVFAREPGTRPGCFFFPHARRAEKERGGCCWATSGWGKKRDINKWMEGGERKNTEEAKLDTRKLLAFWHSSGLLLRVCARVWTCARGVSFLALHKPMVFFAVFPAHTHTHTGVHAHRRHHESSEAGELTETPSVFLIKQGWSPVWVD